MTEANYVTYTADFNAACSGNMKFATFYDKYYEQDAHFEFMPTAHVSKGKTETVQFWETIMKTMQETMLPHTLLMISKEHLAVEVPIDFKCKQDVTWMGQTHAQGSVFRVMVGGFYDLNPESGLIKAVRIYSVYNKAYQPK